MDKKALSSGYQQIRQQQLSLPQIDHDNAVWTAYLNCLNSFNTTEMQTTMVGAAGTTTSSTTSKVTLTRFTYFLALLDGLLEEDKDVTFKEKCKEREIPDNVPDIIDNEDGFAPSDLFRYWAFIDGLMRRKEFYKKGKIDYGHM